jgi:type VI secretion system protein ImpK
MPTDTSPTASGRLALLLQEALTAVVRLRADRQPVSDATAFRTQMTQLLAKAEQEARAAGYPEQDARLGVFAVVAFLDETALNARQPALADWSRRPLQDELYGGHMAGEWFFQHVDQLLARADDPTLADVLEVHQLVLLLGFKGKYGVGDGGQLAAITQRVGERLARLRGAPGDLAPAWRPPDDAVATRDPWLRRLTTALVVLVVLVAGAWGVATFTLAGTRDGIARLASAPVASAPVASAPVASAPVANAPLASAPVASAPVAHAPTGGR